MTKTKISKSRTPATDSISAQTSDRLSLLAGKTLFSRLSQEHQRFIEKQFIHHHFSQQDLKQLCEITTDLEMWGDNNLLQIWPDESQFRQTGKALKQRVLNAISNHWQMLRSQVNHYPQQNVISKVSSASRPILTEKVKLGLGYCPVASPQTRCCNLQTLDAVENCGYGCSYCSIQSFFDGKQISFDSNFSEKLKNLELDPDKIYHIGTGQSSDSLMWGNSHGVLDAVIDFASRNDNLIMELKTKSANIKHLLKSSLPKNLICTWSLNTPTLIEHEEHGTANLDKRLQAARALADKGVIVGFHFHPIVHYDRWREDYQYVIQKLSELFDHDEVALVSMGTLTFIKPVIREIRKRGIASQILKIPLVDAQGKYSYPIELKTEMFSHVYDRFPSSWKEQVFFYLCMESQALWQPVFGFSYPSNDAFEAAMKMAYLGKIRNIP